MAALHPQVVHFTIVLALIGVGFRLVSLFGRPAFAGPAAATLIVMAAASSVISVRSGEAAHGPVERIPGVRSAVATHEGWGERTQMVLLVLGAIELIGLALRRSPRAKAVHAVAAAVGLVAVYSVYETGQRGGELVYWYAGGVGLRTGDPRDTERLLLAGYYNQAIAERAAGHPDRAADLIDSAAQRFSGDVEIRLLSAESLLLDRKDPAGALEALKSVDVPSDNRVLNFRKTTLLADAYEASGQKEEAAASLERLLQRFPNPRLQQRLNALRRTATAPAR